MTAVISAGTALEQVFSIFAVPGILERKRTLGTSILKIGCNSRQLFTDFDFGVDRKTETHCGTQTGESRVLFLLLPLEGEGLGEGEPS
jgi:hypothetical protein